MKFGLQGIRNLLASILFRKLEQREYKNGATATPVAIAAIADRGTDENIFRIKSRDSMLIAF